MKCFSIPATKSLMTDAGFPTTLHTVRILLAQKNTPKVLHPETGQMVRVLSVEPETVDGVKYFKITHE